MLGMLQYPHGVRPQVVLKREGFPNKEIKYGSSFAGYCTHVSHLVYAGSQT